LYQQMAESGSDVATEVAATAIAGMLVLMKMPDGGASQWGPLEQPCGRRFGGKG
jgi:hypothetical protein